MVADLRPEEKGQGIGPTRSQELSHEAKSDTRCRLYVLLVGCYCPGNSWTGGGKWERGVDPLRIQSRRRWYVFIWGGSRQWDNCWGEGLSLSLVQEFVGMALL